MAFSIGKRMTARAPVARVEAAGAPFLAGGLPKVGSVLTMNTGVWNGHPPFNPRFQWYFGTSSIVNATNQSHSIQSAGSGLTCRMSQGNNKWGTNYKDAVASGTVLP